MTTTRTRRRRIRAVVLVAIAGVAVAWTLLPWEWSMIDDPGFVLSIRDEMDQHGFLLGLLWHVQHMVEVDLSWGLFRPAYWVYPSLVYWLPIGLAHLLRLLLLVVAIAGPAVALRRRGASGLVVAAAVCVMLSGAASLMLGLIHVSLQELSGAAFVGLGLWMRRPWLRLVMWVIAAWFKVTFVWILVGEALVLWREGRRRRAAITATIAVVTLAAAFALSRGGDYTSAYLSGGDALAVIGMNVVRLADFPLTFPIIAVVWWFAITRSRPHLDRDASVLLVGLLGYTLQMLPWSVTGHYQGGIAYLLTVFLAATMTEPVGLGRRTAVVALAVPALLAAITVSSTLWLLMATNARFRGITDCLASRPNAQVLLASEFGSEAAVRIEQNARLANPAWGGMVTFETAGALDEASSGTLLIVPTERAATLGDVQVVCEVPAAVVLERQPS